MADKIKTIETKRELITRNITEHDVELCVDDGSLSSKHSDCYYDYNSKLTRALIATSLAAYCETDCTVFRPVRCLETLGSTGVCGLTWAKHLDCSKIEVTINSASETATQRIRENTERNQLQNEIKITNFDPRIALHQHAYNFVVLESFANSSMYLDSVMRHLPRGGVLVLSTIDDPALYCKVPEVALRKYGGYIGKTHYYREMAARLIIASLVRSAAVHDKSVRVLWCYTNKGLLTIAVQLDRGPIKANESLTHLRNLLHCNICEDRVFVPENNSYLIADPYSLLRCNCHTSYPGKTALQLGPLWSAELFDPRFLRLMITQKLPWTADTKELLERLLEEALCPNIGSQTADIDSTDESPAIKKQKLAFMMHDRFLAPPFYYNIHKNKPKDAKLLRADRVVTCLRNAGFRASRTHFDPEAVRTDASLQQFHCIMLKGFIPQKEENNSAEF